jgi:hypothetical protein
MTAVGGESFNWCTLPPSTTRSAWCRNIHGPLALTMASRWPSILLDMQAAMLVRRSVPCM